MRRDLNLIEKLYDRQIRSPKAPSFEIENRFDFAEKYLPNTSRSLFCCSSKVFVSHYAKDGDLLIVGSQDEQIHIFDSSRFHYKLIETIYAREVGWSILDIAVSPDGEYLIYSSWSEKIHQCKIEPRSESTENHVPFDLNPPYGRFCCFCLRFSPDYLGSEILAGSNDASIYIYDRASNQRTLRVKAHDADVNAVCFAGQTANIFYTGSDDGIIKVWDRRCLNEDNVKHVACFCGHADGITCIDSKGDSRYLISNSKDQTIKLWDLRRPSKCSDMAAAKRLVSIQTSDYRWQALNCIKTHKKCENDASVFTFQGHIVLHTLIRCRFSPIFSTGQRMIYAGCASGTCVVYCLNSGNTVARLKGHESCIRDCDWHPYQNEIVTSAWDSRVKRWTYNGETVREISDKDNNTSYDYFNDSFDAY